MCLIIFVFSLCVHVCVVAYVTVILKGAHIHSPKSDNNHQHLHTAGSSYSKVHTFRMLQKWIEPKLHRVPCSHVFTLGERQREDMCRRLQCEKDSIEVWECDVSLCQGYVTIWAALVMIRLKYKVL